jgi:hypothetical protein
MNWLRRYLRNVLNSGEEGRSLASAGYLERTPHNRVSMEVDTAVNGYVINVTKYPLDFSKNANVRHDGPIREMWICKTKEELDDTIRAAMVSITLKGN